jgi:hypothetical protein
MSQQNTKSGDEKGRNTYTALSGVARWLAVLTAISAIAMLFIREQLWLVWVTVGLLFLSVLLDRSSKRTVAASLLAIILALIYIFTR